MHKHFWLTPVEAKYVTQRKVKFYGKSEILDGTEVVAHLNPHPGFLKTDQVKIFFPHVSIAGIDSQYIQDLQCRHYMFDSWKSKAGYDDEHWRMSILHTWLSDFKGWLIVHGFVYDKIDWNSESYFALIHDEDLYSKRKREYDAVTKKVDDEMLKEAGFKSWDEFHAWEREDQARELEEKLKPIKTLEKAGRFEEAAIEYEKLEMFDKAGEVRRMAKTTYVIAANFHLGKDGQIDISCPYCGGKQLLKSKSNEITCDYCNKTYIIPRKILDML